MEKKRINEKKISIVLATIYFIILTWIIVFKMQFSLENLHGIRNINLVPFGQSVVVNGKIHLDEIIDNIIIFIPAGLYFQMIKKDWKIGKKIGIIAAISLSFEILQYIFAIGATDITDLIGNTFGGILGLGIYQIFYQILKTQEKTNQILNRLAIVGTGLLVLLMGLLIGMN